MPLKPVLKKNPLSALTCQPLSAGQVRLNNKTLKTLYTQVANCHELPMLEGTFRLSALLVKDAAQSASAKTIRTMMLTQREDGSFPLTVRETLSLLRAVWALYEYETQKETLSCLLRWMNWASKRWEEIIADDTVCADPADLMELLENVYRVTGISSLLKLCTVLSESTMNWGSILTTASFQTPVSHLTTETELAEGLKNENGDLEGYYTRLTLTNHGGALADGARASMLRGWLSGSSKEMNAAQTGWERLSRHHGAICGGVTADPLLAGTNPSLTISSEVLGAWTEAFVSAGMGIHAGWAWEALERLLINAMPACVQENQLLSAQRVNSFADTTCVDKLLPRFCRGYALAMQSAVTAWEDGCAVNLLMSGKYVVCGNKIVLSIEENAGKHNITLHMKSEQSAVLRIRIPSWAASSNLLLNGEHINLIKLIDGYAVLDRIWHDGDEINVELEKKLTRCTSHHQGTYLLYGAQVMALPIEDDWRYAMCSDGIADGDVIKASLAPIAWKQDDDAPHNLPVLPPLTGEVRECVLVPYADALKRIALFPRGDRA